MPSSHPAHGLGSALPTTASSASAPPLTPARWQDKPRQLAMIMAVAVSVVSGATLALLYQAALQQQTMRLIEVAQSRAELIQAVARFDAQHSQDAHPDGATAATLSQIRDAHREFAGFGRTGEFTLARRDDEQIIFLLSHRHADLDAPQPVAWQAANAEPMRRALQGRSGTLIGLDYRGQRVLAAHEPLPFLGWGIVAKIDLTEIRQPFIRAGMVVAALALLAILLGAWLFFRIADPIVERLADGEQRLGSIIATAVDGVICISPTGVVQVFNRAAENIFGYSASETLGHNVSMLMAEHERSHHDGYLTHYMETGKHTAIGRKREVQGRRKNGQLFPLQLAISEVRNAHGQVISFTGIARDISAEKALQKELRQHAVVFQCASEAIMILDADGKILQVNPAFTRLTGYSAEDVLGDCPDILFDTQQDQTHFREMDSALRQKGRWQGDAWARKCDGAMFPVWITTTAIYDGDAEVSQYIRMFTDISERKLAEEHMRFLAQHDTLTGLANRALFEDRCRHALQRAERTQGRFALLYIDLDRFKPVNDAFGHAVGDELLHAVALALQQHLRKEDTLARLGGDEFGIVLEEVHSDDAVKQVADKLLESLASPFEINGHCLQIGASIGISIYPQHGKNSETLIQRADAAMYAAKRQGCARYVIAPDPGPGTADPEDAGCPGA